MSIADYETALITALNKLLGKYKNRIANNKGREHKHVTPQEALGIIGPCAAVAGAVGTVAPGIGNAIGAGAGAALGAIVVGVIEARHIRTNKKVDNAAKVMDFLGMSQEDQDAFVINAAQRVIEERKAMLSSLKETPKNRTSVAAYLAANMMAAIKQDAGSNAPKTDIITQGLIETMSKKVSSRPLKAEDDEQLTLKEIAQNRLRR